eukprot:scaffold56226_cov66-Phaeocystis_antarctica.AAC.1
MSLAAVVHPIKASAVVARIIRAASDARASQLNSTNQRQRSRGLVSEGGGEPPRETGVVQLMLQQTNAVS